jgi:hypothetical protein
MRISLLLPLLALGGVGDGGRAGAHLVPITATDYATVPHEVAT